MTEALDLFGTPIAVTVKKPAGAHECWVVGCSSAGCYGFAAPGTKALSQARFFCPDHHAIGDAWWRSLGGGR